MENEDREAREKIEEIICGNTICTKCEGAECPLANECILTLLKLGWRKVDTLNFAEQSFIEIMANTLVLKSQAWIECPECEDGKVELKRPWPDGGMVRQPCPSCTSGKMYLWKVRECEKCKMFICPNCGIGPRCEHRDICECNFTGQIISPLSWEEYFGIKDKITFSFDCLEWRGDTLYQLVRDYHGVIAYAVFTLPDGSHILRSKK